MFSHPKFDEVVTGTVSDRLKLHILLNPKPRHKVSQIYSNCGKILLLAPDQLESGPRIRSL